MFRNSLTAALNFAASFGQNLLSQIPTIAIGIARIAIAADVLTGVGMIATGVTAALTATLKPPTKDLLNEVIWSPSALVGTLNEMLFHTLLGGFLFFVVAWQAGVGYYLLYWAGAFEVLSCIALPRRLDDKLPWCSWTVPGWFGLVQRRHIITSSAIALVSTVAIFLFT